MKTLSVKAWWAWALIHGSKRVENRTWRTNYRGSLAIHASLNRRGFKSDREFFPELPAIADLEFGAVIGTLELLDCIPLDQLDETSHDAGDRRYAVGPWLWITAEPRALIRPFPCLGHLSFFNVELPADVLPALDCGRR
jgi:hypothetical protein